MTVNDDEDGSAAACERCLRRGWLLARLSPLLDRVAPDRARLLALLDLHDDELIDALAGRSRDETHSAHRKLEPPASLDRAVQTTCVHRSQHPRALARQPSMLYVLGSVGRLRELSDAPVVAVLGSERSTDYGAQMAASIARELSACGVTVASYAAKGTGNAAQQAALQTGSRAVALYGDGFALACRGPARSFLSQLTRDGCAVSELPGDADGRRWGRAAAERLAVQLAQVVVVVDGAETARDLAAAHRARELGRRVAAVPGRASSQQAGAPLALLREGASLVTGAADVLELLEPPARPDGVSPRAPVGLEPLQRALLTDVGCGCDSAEALSRHREEPLEEILLALTQLELIGFLARGRGGRYVPTAATPREARADA